MTIPTPDIYHDNHATLRLALCQVETEAWDIAGNTERCLAALQVAGEAGATLAITPECVFHGYGFADAAHQREAYYAAAEKVDGPLMGRVADVARAFEMYCVVGFLERDEEDRLYNSAATFDPFGNLVDVYRKVHLRPFEDVRFDGYFTAGEIFLTRSMAQGDSCFTVGTMICFDREIPESARSLRGLGAELIACPLATNTSDLREGITAIDNESITLCRAAENELFIAVVNHAGRFNGGSFIAGPGGELVVQLGAEPAVEVIDLPLGVVKARFHQDPYGWMGWGYRSQAVYDCALKG